METDTSRIIHYPFSIPFQLFYSVGFVIFIYLFLLISFCLFFYVETRSTEYFFWIFMFFLSVRIFLLLKIEYHEDKECHLYLVFRKHYLLKKYAEIYYFFYFRRNDKALLLFWDSGILSSDFRNITYIYFYIIILKINYMDIFNNVGKLAGLYYFRQSFYLRSWIFCCFFLF